jgi:putative hydrolase of the HAD superfamily
MEELGFVFDLDDTLYPERDYVRSCFRWIAPRLGGEGLFDELWRRFEAGERDPISAVAAAHGIDERQKAGLVAEMREHSPDITLDEGAAALIAGIRGAGRRFSIITNGRSLTQRAKIAALGLGDAAAIVISEEFGAAKPDAALFRAIERHHPARRHLFAGDNPAVDFEGPNALGWMTAMVDRENGVKREAFGPREGQRAQRVISSLAELIALV